ncbi:MAG TPA: signal peptidase II [Tepidiformaceae bacterium]
MEDVSAPPAPVSPAARRARIRLSDGWFLLLALLVVVADQLTKWLVRGNVPYGGAWPSASWPIRIVHFTNSGAAFGSFQGAGPLLAITSLVGVGAVLVYLFNPGFAHPIMRIGFALMLGGATGNLIDRVVNGEVVDFIHLPYFWAFNVADSAITIGVLLLIWAMTKQPSGNSTLAT